MAGGAARRGSGALHNHYEGWNRAGAGSGAGSADARAARARPRGSHAQYVAPGYLIYAVAGTLRAVAFDLERQEVTGSPVPVVENVVIKAFGAVDASVAADGTLVYVPVAWWRCPGGRWCGSIGKDGKRRLPPQLGHTATPGSPPTV